MFRPPFTPAILLGGAIALLCCGAVQTAPAAPIDLTQKTVSSSRQFVIYCSDSALRAQVANIAEQIKSDVLTVLGESDGWRTQRTPIVITLVRASTEDRTQAPVTFGVYQIEGGIKIGIDVRIGDNPAAINLQRHLVRALLLEYAYRGHTNAIHDGVPYVEPPWWLVEGAIQLTKRRDKGVDTALFKQLVETNKLPPLEQFLVNKPTDFGQTAEALDQACAMCLVQLLIEQPDGRASLANFLKRLPESTGDVAAALKREFPSLAGGQSLQRWWTLNLARFAAADRYKGLSPEETDAQLSSMIQLDLPVGKEGDRRSFSLSQFDEYLKLPASRAALLAGQAGMVTLSTQASALYRPVVSEYEEIFSLLARGKTRGIRERLTRIDRYRESVLRRTTDIADYLNWFEATQTAQRSDTFDSYLKIANELETPMKRHDPISNYLDEVAQEF